MSLKRLAEKLIKGTRIGLAAVAMLQFSIAGPLASSAQAQEQEHGGTATPIKHVIVIVGENRTFDHIFATYKAKNGQYVGNLLSKEIINEDGSPSSS